MRRWDGDRSVGETWNAIQPHAAGVYVNELGDDEGDDRVRQAYVGNYPRLARIKARYDPDNLFRLNANITPDRSALQAAGGSSA